MMRQITTILVGIILATTSAAHAIGCHKLAWMVSCQKQELRYLISCEDQAGNIWSFWDAENYWHEDDFICLTMKDNKVIDAQRIEEEMK